MRGDTGEAAVLEPDDNEDELQAKPFVKWAGGKTQILSELKKRIPGAFNRYFEPFLGGGALYFALTPKQSFLSDTNEELINTYRVIRDDLDKLLVELSKHKYEESYYYKIRSMDRDPLFQTYPTVIRAARFIYLNKACYNGLYRVNKSGYFNTPFGKYTNPTILDEKNLRACHKVLQRADLRVSPFDWIVEEAQQDDFVYFDPPYSPLSETADFTSYTKEGFGDDMQRTLYETCVALSEKKVSFLLSNSSAQIIKDLYQQFRVEEVPALRAINSKSDKRGAVTELLVRNY